jgi:DNA-binding CsgD family transcriptional regulator
MDTIADRLHVSRNTILTHLAHLFAKTNTKRQAELIRVLLSVTGPPGRS